MATERRGIERLHLQPEATKPSYCTATGAVRGAEPRIPICTAFVLSPRLYRREVKDVAVRTHAAAAKKLALIGSPPCGHPKSIRERPPTPMPLYLVTLACCNLHMTTEAPCPAGMLDTGAATYYQLEIEVCEDYCPRKLHPLPYRVTSRAKPEWQRGQGMLRWRSPSSPHLKECFKALFLELIIMGWGELAGEISAACTCTTGPLC